MSSYILRGIYHPIFSFEEGTFQALPDLVVGSMKEVIGNAFSMVQNDNDALSPDAGDYIVVKEIPQNGRESAIPSLAQSTTCVFRVSSAAASKTTSPTPRFSYSFTELISFTPIIGGATTPLQAYQNLRQLWRSETAFRPMSVQVTYFSPSLLTPGGGGGTGVERLAELLDVDILAPSDGNMLVWNQATQRWKNNAIGLVSDSLFGWVEGAPPIGSERPLTYKKIGAGPYEYTFGPSSTALGVDKFVDLTDVQVAATPIPGAVTMFSSSLNKFVQSPAITHDAAGDDKIALETAGAIGILSTGGNVGIQATGGELAVAGAGDTSLTSGSGNVNITSLTNTIALTSAVATTVTATAAVAIESLSGTVDVTARTQLQLVSGDEGISLSAPTADKVISLSAPSGTVFLDAKVVENSNELQTVSIAATQNATFRAMGTTTLGEESNGSVTNIRGDEINVVMPQSGLALIPQSNGASVVEISTDNKTAAQYALDVTGIPEAVPNVAYVSSAITSAISGNDATDIKVGGQAPASTLAFGTTNTQDISITKNSNAVFGTSSGPDKTYVRNQTGGSIDVVADSSVVVTAAGGNVTVSADAGISLSCPGDQITIQGFNTLFSNSANTATLSVFDSGELKSLVPAYEALVTTDNTIPNKKYVDGQIGKFTFSPSIEPETISTQSQALGKQGAISLARYWRIDTTYTLNLFIAGRKNLGANNWACAYRNMATGELMFIRAFKASGLGTVTMSTVGEITATGDGTLCEFSLWYDNALTLPVVNRGSSSVNSVSDTLDTVLNAKYIVPSGGFRINTRDVLSFAQTNVVGTGLSQLVSPTVGFEDPTLLSIRTAGNSADLRAMLRFSGGANATRFSVSAGTTVVFDDTSDYYPEYYILKSTITNNTFTPSQVNYNMTALTNVNFVNASTTASFVVPITQFTQANVDDRLIIVKILTPATTRSYRFDGNMSNTITTALTPFTYTLGIGAGQVRPAPYLLPKIFASMVGNTTPSGGTNDVINWLQGPLAISYASAFTLTTNNTITYSSLFPDYNPQTFEVTYAGLCTTPSNDRTIQISLYKNPTTIINPPIGELVTTSTLQVVARTNDSPSFSSGSFTVSLTSGNTLRFYTTNLENNDAPTVVDFKISIKPVID